MRRAIVVDRQKLEAAIEVAEADGPLKNHSKLYHAVAELYNGDNPPEAITPAVVMLRIREWGTIIKTMSRSEAKDCKSTSKGSALDAFPALSGNRSTKDRKTCQYVCVTPGCVFTTIVPSESDQHRLTTGHDLLPNFGIPVEDAESLAAFLERKARFAAVIA